jgi:hypothetical protein
MTTVEQLATEDASNGDETLSAEERIGKCSQLISEALQQTNCRINIIPSPAVVVLVDNQQVHQTFGINITSK